MPFIGAIAAMGNVIASILYWNALLVLALELAGCVTFANSVAFIRSVSALSDSVTRFIVSDASMIVAHEEVLWTLSDRTVMHIFICSVRAMRQIITSQVEWNAFPIRASKLIGSAIRLLVSVQTSFPICSEVSSRTFAARSAIFVQQAYIFASSVQDLALVGSAVLSDTLYGG